ncbi:MAG: organomercurial transporter MerC [Rhodoferax sp.]|jgi:mercuric ion transport protein|uniref:organomercurial transporter MerC n=1 Tax=Rhodoferax sp. TaxID=50421 RepID=UPI0027226123|nr:organomercurial transporter MerC [Rhodoferax sp.]MDO9143162.1 organomercurial transporter MerC [Rhodoferax sp.]MDP1531294.1 organomercurial transporter MerC [Rhodoferax sp.]MDP1942344.1 organomercurial transporter MerC [Rhodoferax sp.]MDP2440075.1 organomercurial transporter MerC [Rhodoferax sp.]MDP3192637.1 organomercurial transporter MerC [Rhodoferax sp.]
MTLITRIADKAGTFGSVVSAFGCAACFPAIASIGAALGLGFLQGYESLFISRLMPLFAALALLANALGWLGHRQWHRSVLGMIGPTLVLGALGWLGGEGWPISLLYAGLGLMLAVSIWDLLWPSNRRCARDGCELPTTPA